MSKQKNIEQQLEQALLAGRWKLSERLPAERALAEEFAVNRTTLRAAISALAGRGILETKHGSGTCVRSIPVGSSRQNTPDDKLYASFLLIPSIIHECSLLIKPSQILGLERLLPVAGVALRNNDTKGFIQAQIQFFTEAAKVIGSNSINAALSACLPEGKAFIRLFGARTMQENEMIFALLARILSSMRHADANEASAAAQAYFSALRVPTKK